MLNKKVLLASLVAGAMVLPMTASAGIVTGACANCHTMHQTDGDNNPIAVTAQLLGGNSCENCHAVSGQGNDANGVYDNGSYGAPQVDDTTNPNLAGFFDTAGPGADNTMHNVSTSLTAINADGTLTSGSPGGGFPLATCNECHTMADGGHHGNGSTVYRMLFDASGTDMNADPIFGASAGQLVPNASATTYDADEMNDVCNNCHGDFHNLAAVTNQLSGGEWVRHPTDVDLADGTVNTMQTYGATYAANWSNGGALGADTLPLGVADSAQALNIVGGGGTQTMMCITCHYSHGGPYADLLRFDYNNGNTPNVSPNVAGDTTASMGCETCHDYNGTPQNGM